MWVPYQKKKKKNKKMKFKTNGMTEEMQRKRVGEVILIFFLLLVLSQIYGNLSVGFRRDKHGKCSTRRGLRVSTKNTRFHREFR